MKTKLYTDEQLFHICQSVAEKVCANSLDKEDIIDKCKQYGHSKIEIDDESIKDLIDDDTIEIIDVAIVSISSKNDNICECCNGSGTCENINHEKEACLTCGGSGKLN